MMGKNFSKAFQSKKILSDIIVLSVNLFVIEPMGIKIFLRGATVRKA